MQVAVVTGCEADWRRRISLEVTPYPLLLWAAGPESVLRAPRLSAILSEKGLPNRYVPLYKRPYWIEVLAHEPWDTTPLARYLKETPLLVLGASLDQLRRVWQALKHQHLLTKTLFLVQHYKHPLLQGGPALWPSEQSVSADWEALCEDLRPDLLLAKPWQPCYLVSQLP
jgi:hypothetical protein